MRKSTDTRGKLGRPREGKEYCLGGRVITDKWPLGTRKVLGRGARAAGLFFSLAVLEQKGKWLTSTRRRFFLLMSA